MTVPWTTDSLSAVLGRDFKPDDLGDDSAAYADRLTYTVTAALSRTAATPEQQEAGARYVLLGAWVRQLIREVEVLTVPGQIGITQGLAARLAQLRAEQHAQLLLSGLPGSAGAVRPTSLSVPVRSTY